MYININNNNNKLNILLIEMVKAANDEGQITS